jgi:hypothetical protein
MGAVCPQTPEDIYNEMIVIDFIREKLTIVK